MSTGLSTLPLAIDTHGEAFLIVENSPEMPIYIYMYIAHHKIIHYKKPWHACKLSGLVQCNSAVQILH